MKIKAFVFGCLMFWCTAVRCQEKSPETNHYRNFPLTISLQFQNLALPFKDLGSNFMHWGVAIGTEVSLNGKSNWVQQFQAGYYVNKEAGNGFTLTTQTVYRPSVFEHFYPELKVGVGWQRVFHPVDAYVYDNGSFRHVNGGKSQVIVPLGFSLGYENPGEKTYASPFVSYEVTPALFYNDGIPLLFYSTFQVGTRIHFQ